MERSVLTVLSVIVVLSSQVFCSKHDSKCEEYSRMFKDNPIEVSKLSGPPSTLGKEATAPGEFPHMAALGFKSEKGIEWLCGGSLISDEYILTSAVCTRGPNGPVSVVRLNDHNIKSNADDKNVEECNVARIIPHPLYKPPSVYNDIALLQLDRKVVFTPTLRPACLYSSLEWPKNVQISAIGWGKINFGGLSSDTLMKVYLDPFENGECQDEYRTAPKRKLKEGIVEKLLVCAGGKSSPRDTCKGDAGGPLQFLNKEKNIYELIGISSFGKVCGKVGIPSVYTRIATYIPWIESIVWP